MLFFFFFFFFSYFRYRCYYLMFIILFYFISIMFVFIMFCLHRCYNGNYVYSLVSSLISLPHLCTDVVVLDIITLVCTDVTVQGYYLFSVLERNAIYHPRGVAGCISQCFCLMWDCLLWCIWPPLLLLPYCGLHYLLF